jgi:hypothetical protein
MAGFVIKIQSRSEEKRDVTGESLTGYWSGLGMSFPKKGQLGEKEAD